MTKQISVHKRACIKWNRKHTRWCGDFIDKKLIACVPSAISRYYIYQRKKQIQSVEKMVAKHSAKMLKWLLRLNWLLLASKCTTQLHEPDIFNTVIAHICFARILFTLFFRCRQYFPVSLLVLFFLLLKSMFNIRAHHRAYDETTSVLYFVCTLGVE